MSDKLFLNCLVDQYLDVESHVVAGVRIVLRQKDRCFGDRTQHWEIEDAGCGFSYIRHAASTDLYLTVRDGLSNCGNGLVLGRKGCHTAGQKFKLECGLIITDLSQRYIPEIVLEAGQACSSGYVFINGKMDWGSQAEAQKWTTFDVAAPPEPETPTCKTETDALVVSAATNMYLDVESSACENVRVVLRNKDQCFGDRTQHWIFESAGCGYYYFRHAMSTDLYLTVRGGLPNCGNGLILARKNCQSGGQRFKFERGLIVTDLHQPCFPIICLEAGQACATGFVFINAEQTCGPQVTYQQWGTQAAY